MDLCNKLIETSNEILLKYKTDEHICLIEKQAKIINDVFYRIAFNCGKTYKVEFCKKPIRLIVVDNRTKDNVNNILYDSDKGSLSPDVEKVFNFTKYM